MSVIGSGFFYVTLVIRLSTILWIKVISGLEEEKYNIFEYRDPACFTVMAFILTVIRLFWQSYVYFWYTCLAILRDLVQSEKKGLIKNKKQGNIYFISLNVFIFYRWNTKRRKRVYLFFFMFDAKKIFLFFPIFCYVVSFTKVITDYTVVPLPVSLHCQHPH